jgi:NAD(P)-dependent dehydrogenase (short-subunit alcohol dehydrogenase family)
MMDTPQDTSLDRPLAGRVALVAGGTRGAGRGIAVQLGAAGATVYVTGRSSRAARSEMNRPETIEETAELVDAAGGRGVPVRVDHLVPEDVAALVARIEEEQGALHVLVNDIFGVGDDGSAATAPKMEWSKSVWESDLALGLRTVRLSVDTHAITSHFALPLLLRSPGGLVVEVTDGTDEYNATNYRVSFFYDLAKAAVNRMAFALAHELGALGATAVSLTPGWLRSEVMLDGFGVTEANWQDATARIPHFAISETPAYVGRAVAALAQDPDVARWNGRSLSSGQLAQVYGFTDVDGSQPDAWRYLVEVQDPGKPADVTGYR